MGWDFATEPAFQEHLDWMKTFMKEEVWPLEVIVDEIEGDRFWRLVWALQEEVKKRGLWATHLTPEYGGQGMGQVKLGLMHEIEGSSIWGPVVFGNNAPDTGNAELLALFGSAEQKAKWLYPLLDNKIYSGFSMTEPEHAGSDPVNMSTTAVLEGDEWLIDGHKWFTSNGLVASILIVMVVTDPDAPPYERASMILIPSDTPGVDLVRNIPTMGDTEHFGFGHTEIYYRNVRVPMENLLGARGQGFAIAQRRLGPGRIHHCMRWLGQSQRAFDIMCERALQREAFGGPLAAKQSIQNFIADSAAEMDAARLMTLHAAWKMDAFGQEAARREIGIIKYFGARVLNSVIDRAIQTCGALGYSGDLPLEAMYRHARGARIYDGADEVHRQTVSRLVLRDHQSPAGIFPTDHIPTRRLAARHKFAHLLEEPSSVEFIARR